MKTSLTETYRRLCEAQNCDEISKPKSSACTCLRQGIYSHTLLTDKPKHVSRIYGSHRLRYPVAQFRGFNSQLQIPVENLVPVKALLRIMMMMMMTAKRDASFFVLSLNVVSRRASSLGTATQLQSLQNAVTWLQASQTGGGQLIPPSPQIFLSTNQHVTKTQTQHRDIADDGKAGTSGYYLSEAPGPSETLAPICLTTWRHTIPVVSLLHWTIWRLLHKYLSNNNGHGQI